MRSRLRMKYLAHFSLLKMRRRKMRYRMSDHITFKKRTTYEIPTEKTVADPISTTIQTKEAVKMEMSSLS